MENCCDYFAAIWRLTTFCGFYGKAVPFIVKDGVFKKFYTHSRDEDVKDLYVEFNKNLAPMSYMDLVVSSRSLFVIGHGKAEEDYRGSVFYDKYTLFSEEQIKAMAEKNAIVFKGSSNLKSLLSYNQAVIYNYEDYSME
ncbi:MAG: hypothetical protein MJZ76_10600 [Bacteroidales bacterium]|nr:hypothetical protein [Bacteroidales bacterium]